MGVGHGIGCLDDAGQSGHVDDLLVDLGVHGAHQVGICIEDTGHAHGARRLQAPGILRQLFKLTQIHRCDSSTGRFLPARSAPALFTVFIIKDSPQPVRNGVSLPRRVWIPGDFLLPDSLVTFVSSVIGNPGQTSTTHCAVQRPSASCASFSSVKVAPLISTAGR